MISAFKGWYFYIYMWFCNIAAYSYGITEHEYLDDLTGKEVRIITAKETKQ